VSPPRRKALAFLAVAAASAASAVALVPREGVEQMTAALTLETLFPLSFGGWNLDPTVFPLEPGADVRKALIESYDQTLSRTYVNRQGYSVMLSVAYGGRRNQGLDIHRPEVCYPSQGLAIRRDTREAVLTIGQHRLPLKRLVAGSGNRNEPISYWLVIGNGLASFGYGHRLALMKYGLTGHVPDGMLLRVSSVDENVGAAYAEQDTFLRDLISALSPEFRRRVLGEG
jgi:EpsI family protein